METQKTPVPRTGVFVLVGLLRLVNVITSDNKMFAILAIADFGQRCNTLCCEGAFDARDHGLVLLRQSAKITPTESRFRPGRIGGKSFLSLLRDLQLIVDVGYADDLLAAANRQLPQVETADLTRERHRAAMACDLQITKLGASVLEQVLNTILADLVGGQLLRGTPACVRQGFEQRNIRHRSSGQNHKKLQAQKFSKNSDEAWSASLRAEP